VGWAVKVSAEAGVEEVVVFVGGLRVKLAMAAARLLVNFGGVVPRCRVSGRRVPGG